MFIKQVINKQEIEGQQAEAGDYLLNHNLQGTILYFAYILDIVVENRSRKLISKTQIIFLMYQHSQKCLDLNGKLSKAEKSTHIKKAELIIVGHRLIEKHPTNINNHKSLVVSCCKQNRTDLRDTILHIPCSLIYHQPCLKLPQQGIAQFGMKGCSSLTLYKSFIRQETIIEHSGKQKINQILFAAYQELKPRKVKNTVSTKIII